jgi:hypothetical protein
VNLNSIPVWRYPKAKTPTLFALLFTCPNNCTVNLNPHYWHSDREMSKLVEKSVVQYIQQFNPDDNL